MQRRQFITLLGGAATVFGDGWPLVGSAQQASPGRRMGMLLGWSERDPEFRANVLALLLELARLGWIDGINLRVDQRWNNADVSRAREFAKELVRLKPDVILASSTPATAALQYETSTIPIVFAIASDPVGAGFVASLSRPGGNITGFIDLEGPMGGKWLTLLKEVAPDIKRAAIMFNPDTAPAGGDYFLGSFEAAAKSFGIEPIALRVRSDAEIGAAIQMLGDGEAGLVLTPDSFIRVHLQLIIAMTTRRGVPAIFEIRDFCRRGGLISYGPSFEDIFRRAATYLDRVLRGARASDLPVQVPVKFELVLNLQTAKELGLRVPNTLLVSADEVIEQQR